MPSTKPPRSPSAVCGRERHPRVVCAQDVTPTGRPPRSAELYAAGRIIGYKCYDENFDFMKCKSKQGDAPSACEAQGTAVHHCVYGLFKEISGKAASEFSAYAKCLDQNDLKAHKCKQTQAAFEATYYAA